MLWYSRKGIGKRATVEAGKYIPISCFFSSPWKHTEKQVLCALQAPRETFVLQLAKEIFWIIAYETNFQQ